MLAGYLPFDDDPANPEGDNINLLYKYIVSTPLTFPEYVTPHARDLLKRILVPDPRKRADLFEVARHSWLSEYAHVVGFITSSTTTSSDIANTTVPPGKASFARMLGASPKLSMSRYTRHRQKHANVRNRGPVRSPAACSQCIRPGSQQATYVCRCCWWSDPKARPHRPSRVAGQARQTGRKTQNGASRIRCTSHTDPKRWRVFDGHCGPYGAPVPGWRSALSLQGSRPSGSSIFRWIRFFDQTTSSLGGICTTGSSLAPDSRRSPRRLRLTVRKCPSFFLRKTLYWWHIGWIIKASFTRKLLRPACRGYCRHY